MSHNHQAQPYPHTQRGSMLVISLFIIVIMAILGLSMIKLLSASAQSVVYEVYGQRALNAARSGVEQSLAVVFPLAGQGSPQCSANTVHIFTATEGLNNCAYTSRCELIPVTDRDHSSRYYRFSSTGTCTAGNVVVSRSVSIDAIEL
jgi:MSHA biogenesis protein MshP